MKYSINASITGPIGDSASGTVNVYNTSDKLTAPGAELDFAVLASELEKLRNALYSRVGEEGSNSPERFGDMQKVATAEIAAKKKDGKTIFENLKSVSAWGSKVAQEIGVELVAGLIAAQFTK